MFWVFLSLYVTFLVVGGRGVEEDTVSHKIRDFGNWTRFENKTMTR